MKTFTTLAEKLYQRHQQESDTQYASQRFSWVNNIHKYGLYDMPILGWYILSNVQIISFQLS